MSTYTLVAIACDHCGTERIGLTDETADQLVEASSFGWHQDRLLCPDHYADALAGRPFGTYPPGVF